VSRIPFSILSFLEFVVFSEDSDFPLKSEEMCASSTNVAILPPLLKRAIIAPSQLIDSQHNKRQGEKPRECHSPSQPRSKTHRCKKKLKLLQNDPDTGRIFFTSPPTQHHGFF